CALPICRLHLYLEARSFRMGLETPVGEGSVLLTNINKFVDAVRANSLWPLTFGLACCAIEMMATGASRYDLARFGAEVFRASPRQADLMIVAGRVSQKMAPVLRHIYDQMPEPKWVIAMGACASCGVVLINLPYEALRSVLTLLRDDPQLDYKMLSDLFGVDYPTREKRFDILYNLYSLSRNRRVFLRLRVGEGEPVPTVSDLFPNAD